MADTAPKPKRQRRRRGNNGAAPTADATPSGSNPRGPRKQRRRCRTVAITQNPVVSTRRYIHRSIKRELKKEGLEGPRVSVQQRITSTNEAKGRCYTLLDRHSWKCRTLALAAQYALWKIKYLSLRFTPMVGSSAVSGTVVRASLNLSQSPGGSNWSGLGTRVHLDMHPGQSATFHLRGDQVGGPRDGGWWFTDTNEEGSQSAGPIVEVHTLGKTMSTFQDKEWTGPLFLVEGIGVWQFANYQVKPALGSLERREAEVEADINGEAGQPVTMDLPNNSDVALFMDNLEPEIYNPEARSSGQQSVGETIFQVVDVGAQLAESAAPPPFNWLIKGGWWFVKKLLGRSQRAGKSTYLVYASLSDAQNNKPCIATGTVSSDAKQTKLLVTQINSPNVGPNPSAAASARAGHQTLYPGQPFRVHSEMISELIVSIGPTSGSLTQVPVSAIPGMARDSNNSPATSPNFTNMAYVQTPWWVGVPGRAPDSTSNLAPTANTGSYIHSLYRLVNPRFTDQSGEIEYFHPVPESGVNFCMLRTFGSTGTPSMSNPYAVFGSVVAWNSITAGTNPALNMIIYLIKTTNTYRRDEDKCRDLVAVVGDNAGQARIAGIPHVSGQTEWSILERTIPIGTYLLGVTYTNDVQQIFDVPIGTSLINSTYNRMDTPLAAVFPYYLSGQMFASSSVDTTLTLAEPPVSSALALELLDQFQRLALHAPVPSPLVVDLSKDDDTWWPNDGKVDEDASSTSSEDSVMEFWRDVGNEMITVPRRWEHLFSDDGNIKHQYK
nr:capsid precursor protein [Myotis fimbriatus astrovirus]